MNPITRFLANEISLHMHAMALEKLDTFAQTLHIILCISIDEFNCKTVLIVRCGFLSLKKYKDKQQMHAHKIHFYKTWR